MEKFEKLKRIIARGEHSNHAHILHGDVQFLEDCYKIESSPDYEAGLSLYQEMIEDKKKVKEQITQKYKKKSLKNEDIFREFRSKIREAFYEINSKYNNDIEQLDVVTLRHVFESNFLETGGYVWTKEHPHTPLRIGTYRYNPQYEEHPYLGVIKVTD